MANFSASQTVSFTAMQMYDLVLDIEKYPQFVPFCQTVTIESQEIDAQENQIIFADMRVAHKMVSDSILAKICAHKDNRQINIDYLDGPFSKFEAKWTFIEQPNNCCSVEFFVEYKFKSLAIGLLAGPLFEKTFDKYINAFEERAKVIYL